MARRRLPYLEIQVKRSAGASLFALANEFNTSYGTISKICHGVTPAAAGAKPALATKKCLKCRDESALPKGLFLCEPCRKWATENG